MRKYRRQLRTVEDWKESSEIRHLLKDVLPRYWKKKVEDEEKKRAKKRMTIKIMCGSQYHAHLQEYFQQNMGETERMVSMRQSLYVEVFGEAADQRLLHLHNQEWMKNEPPLRLQEIPARMSLESYHAIHLHRVELEREERGAA